MIREPEYIPPPPPHSSVSSTLSALAASTTSATAALLASTKALVATQLAAATGRQSAPPASAARHRIADEEEAAAHRGAARPAVYWTRLQPFASGAGAYVHVVYGYGGFHVWAVGDDGVVAKFCALRARRQFNARRAAAATGAARAAGGRASRGSGTSDTIDVHDEVDRASSRGRRASDAALGAAFDDVVDLGADDATGMLEGDMDGGLAINEVACVSPLIGYGKPQHMHAICAPSTESTLDEYVRCLLARTATSPGIGGEEAAAMTAPTEQLSHGGDSQPASNASTDGGAPAALTATDGETLTEVPLQDERARPRAPSVSGRCRPLGAAPPTAQDSFATYRPLLAVAVTSEVDDAAGAGAHDMGATMMGRTTLRPNVDTAAANASAYTHEVLLYSVPAARYVHSLRFRTPICGMHSNAYALVVVCMEVVYGFSNHTLELLWRAPCAPHPYGDAYASVALGHSLFAFAPAANLIVPMKLQAQTTAVSHNVAPDAPAALRVQAAASRRPHDGGADGALAADGTPLLPHGWDSMADEFGSLAPAGNGRAGGAPATNADAASGRPHAAPASGGGGGAPTLLESVGQHVAVALPATRTAIKGVVSGAYQLRDAAVERVVTHSEALFQPQRSGGVYGTPARSAATAASVANAAAQRAHVVVCSIHQLAGDYALWRRGVSLVRAATHTQSGSRIPSSDVSPFTPRGRILDVSAYPVACMAFDAFDGYLALADTLGQTMHVYTVQTGYAGSDAASDTSRDSSRASSAAGVPVIPALIHSFRCERGVSMARVTRLAFSAGSSLLCATTDNGTSHCFVLSPSPMDTRLLAEAAAAKGAAAPFSRFAVMRLRHAGAAEGRPALAGATSAPVARGAGHAHSGPGSSRWRSEALGGYAAVVLDALGEVHKAALARAGLLDNLATVLSQNMSVHYDGCLVGDYDIAVTHEGCLHAIELNAEACVDVPVRAPSPVLSAGEGASATPSPHLALPPTASTVHSPPSATLDAASVAPVPPVPHVAIPEGGVRVVGAVSHDGGGGSGADEEDADFVQCSSDEVAKLGLQRDLPQAEGASGMACSPPGGAHADTWMGMARSGIGAAGSYVSRALSSAVAAATSAQTMQQGQALGYSLLHAGHRVWHGLTASAAALQALDLSADGSASVGVSVRLSMRDLGSWDIRRQNYWPDLSSASAFQLASAVPAEVMDKSLIVRSSLLDGACLSARELISVRAKNVSQALARAAAAGAAAAAATDAAIIASLPVSTVGDGSSTNVAGAADVRAHAPAHSSGDRAPLVAARGASTESEARGAPPLVSVAGTPVHGGGVSPVLPDADAMLCVEDEAAEAASFGAAVPPPTPSAPEMTVEALMHLSNLWGAAPHAPARTASVVSDAGDASIMLPFDPVRMPPLAHAPAAIGVGASAQLASSTGDVTHEFTDLVARFATLRSTPALHVSSGGVGVGSPSTAAESEAEDKSVAPASCADGTFRSPVNDERPMSCTLGSPHMDGPTGTRALLHAPPFASRTPVQHAGSGPSVPAEAASSLSPGMAAYTSAEESVTGINSELSRGITLPAGVDEAFDVLTSTRHSAAHAVERRRAGAVEEEEAADVPATEHLLVGPPAPADDDFAVPTIGVRHAATASRAKGSGKKKGKRRGVRGKAANAPGFLAAASSESDSGEDEAAGPVNDDFALTAAAAGNASRPMAASARVRSSRMNQSIAPDASVYMSVFAPHLLEGE